MFGYFDLSYNGRSEGPGEKACGTQHRAPGEVSGGGGCHNFRNLDSFDL